MRVRFSLKSAVINFEINPNWNVLYLKQRICFEFSVNSQDHFLSFNGSQLNEWEKLSACNFSNDSLLLVLPYPSVNHFFIICYECNEVTAADINIICNVCKKNEFKPSSLIRVSDTSSVSGKCGNIDCASENASLVFKCSRNRTHSPVVFLKHMKRNLESETCIACCLNNCDIIISFGCDKSHILCIDCFHAYAKCFLDERKFFLIRDIGYTLQCPSGCSDSYISDTHHFRILGKLLYSNYKEIAAKQVCFIEKFVNCPNCDMCWDLPDNENGLARVVCEGPCGCGVEFCKRCRNFVQSIENQRDNSSSDCFCIQNPHENQDSDSSFPKAPTWNCVKITSDEVASNCVISSTCKTCPTCRSRTQKDGGCNHIHCTVCGGDWCWICVESWSTNCETSHWF